nr:retrotransposon Orf1 [Tanacetum cinerariifolium]
MKDIAIKELRRKLEVAQKEKDGIQLTVDKLRNASKDDEEENMTQPKIEKKTVRPSIVKKEFVKPRQQEKTARKTVKKVEYNRQDMHRPKDNQRNWNNMMSQKLGSNFEMFNKACYKRIVRIKSHLSVVGVKTAELKQLMKIIPDEEEVAIDAIPLAVKSPKIVH